MTEPDSTEKQQNTPENILGDLNEPFGSDKKVLIVEDDPTTTELIRGLLAERHFEISQATNGKDAWDKIRPETTPDIIISDYLMPEMDGFQFFKGLKEADHTKNIPIIFLSARKNMKDSLLVSGADAFLPKPLDTNIFLQTIKKSLLRNPVQGKKSEEKTEEN